MKIKKPDLSKRNKERGVGRSWRYGIFSCSSKMQTLVAILCSLRAKDSESEWVWHSCYKWFCSRYSNRSIIFRTTKTRFPLAFLFLSFVYCYFPCHCTADFCVLMQNLQDALMHGIHITYRMQRCTKYWSMRMFEKFKCTKVYRVHTIHKYICLKYKRHKIYKISKYTNL